MDAEPPSGRGMANSVGQLAADGNARIIVGNSYNYHSEDQSSHDKYLAALRGATDPRDEKRRIEKTNGGLLKDAYSWILDHDDFRRWLDDDSLRLLWISGDAGKGKTMLLCGILNELQNGLTQGSGAYETIAYFFCQNTDDRLKSAPEVLRGLMYLLLLQQPSLLPRLQEKFKHTDEKALTGPTAFHMLSSLLEEMLREFPEEKCYMVVDALDECENGLYELLQFIAETADTCEKVQWIVSSRNLPAVHGELSQGKNLFRISLELSNHFIKEAINIYVDYCIQKLAPLRSNRQLYDEVREKMRLKSGHTFLWVAIVARELRRIPSIDYLNVLDEWPPGLEPLYEAMLKRVMNQPRRRHTELCRLVMSSTLTVFRPLRVEELGSLCNLSPANYNQVNSLKEVIEMCGSFITILDGFVYLIHQSAKDYLTSKGSSFVYPEGERAVHAYLYTRSLEISESILRRDIYDLRHPGIPIEQVERPQSDSLAAAEYPCFFWIYHLRESYSLKKEDRLIRDLLPSHLHDSFDLMRDSLPGGLFHSFRNGNFMRWVEGLNRLKSYQRRKDPEQS